MVQCPLCSGYHGPHCERVYPGQCPLCSDYYGPHCERVCPGQCPLCSGYYGTHCERVCTGQCPGNRCNLHYGFCECPAGRYGISCELKCPPMTYGPNCRHQCMCSPSGTAECNPTVGRTQILLYFDGKLWFIYYPNNKLFFKNDMQKDIQICTVYNNGQNYERRVCTFFVFILGSADLWA